MCTRFRLLYRLHCRYQKLWPFLLALGLMALLLQQIGRYAPKAHETLRLIYVVSSTFVLFTPFFQWFVRDQEWCCYRVWGSDLADLLRTKSYVLLLRQGIGALGLVVLWLIVHPAYGLRDLLPMAAALLSGIGVGLTVGLAYYPTYRYWLAQGAFTAELLAGWAQLLTIGMALLSYLWPAVVLLVVALCWLYHARLCARAARKLDIQELSLDAHGYPRT
ncbi:hypothetical protein [Rhodothermus bifroesti]|uniref:hypothetical protein n=1 Tax=Rhodothermus bifroesti TaxID=2823335 RepID=UPI001AEF80E5|nr:hypothetical protein [Rhodothermus bifroesti]